GDVAARRRRGHGEGIGRRAADVRAGREDRDRRRGVVDDDAGDRLGDGAVAGAVGDGDAQVVGAVGDGGGVPRGRRLRPALGARARDLVRARGDAGARVVGGGRERDGAVDVRARVVDRRARSRVVHRRRARGGGGGV